MEVCGMRIATGIGCVGLLLLPIVTSYADALKTEPDALAKAVAANKAKDYGTSIAIYKKLMDQGSAADPPSL
jgi:hypothetical protein